MLENLLAIRGWRFGIPKQLKYDSSEKIPSYGPTLVIYGGFQNKTYFILKINQEK
jgi:hypothetical protein